jgi:hypothetical protein
MSLEAPVRPAEPVAKEARQSTEVLIKEARRRQRRRQAVIVGVALVVAAAGLLALRLMKTGGSPPTARPPSHHRPPVRPVLSAGQFSGTWHFHTVVVAIQDNGQGSATWPGPLKPGESEATAVPGHAELRVTSVSGTQAIALISGSTVPSAVPNGPARLQITGQDLLYLTPAMPTTVGPFGHSGLCGPTAAALTLAQQVAAGINCGA